MTNNDKNENLTCINYLKISNSNTQDRLLEISNEMFLQEQLKDETNVKNIQPTD